jgi:SAM-dependent methyltransferase
VTAVNELEQEYAMRFERIASYRLAVWKILIGKFFCRWIPDNAAVLDLGCGWGEFIHQVPAARKYAMDLNPAAVSKLAPDVTLFSQDCSERWPLADNQLDIVFTSNFFEHLPNKESLRNTLGEAFRCLKPNGRLICLGPNIKYLPGAYWDFWDHYLPLTEQSLKEGLLLAGFEIDFVKAKFLPYSMSQGFSPPLFFLKLYLKLPFVWSILGKQFCVVARKRASAITK